MGIIKFSVPPSLSLEDVHGLERAAFCGGPDGMPFSAQVRVDPALLTLVRDFEESGFLAVPWRSKNAGHLVASTATLVERTNPYDLLIELARGRINTLRNQSQDWLHGGLNMPVGLGHQIKDATLAFCRSLARYPSDEAHKQAQTALALGAEAADELIRVYANQVFQVRAQNQQRTQGDTKLDTVLGVRLGTAVPTGPGAQALTKACNGFSIPFSIKDTVPQEGEFNFDSYDPIVRWAVGQDQPVWGGPLIDFSSSQIPSWLWLWERDRTRIANLLCEYTAEVIEHYDNKIQTWQLTGAANVPGVLSLQDDELLWLTLQMAEAARKVSPDCDLIVGVSQPWGDYMTQEERCYSPFVFVDTLLRSGLSLSAIDIEVVMGVSPRGSFCRDLLDFSRMLDLYALLGVPLQVTLAYPASQEEDSQADSQLSATAGYWRDGLTPETQADWAGEFVTLALCKPYVRAVQWVHYSDAEPHLFPQCGLLDGAGNPRPAFQRLRRIRDKYLR
ncbi:MAG: endo-1,4-beta-xylanase [Gemmataceae bacterium]